MPPSSSPAAHFVAAVDEEARRSFTADAALDATLGELLTEARRRWPGIEVGEAEFMTVLAARVTASEPPGLPPHGADLYLVSACLAGQPRALAVFDHELMPRCDEVIRRLGLGASDVDEVKQTMREKLLVGAAPRLASYQGAGSLVHWLRAVAGRETLSLLRQRRPEQPIEVELLELGEDPLLDRLKQHYRADFKLAFRTAVATLGARDRAVLRSLVIEEVPVGDIARLYGIHRISASRWLSKIRATLLKRTRRELATRLSLRADELDSVIELIQSHYDVSLASVLASPAPP